ncbi:MAG: type VI secretion system-associated protein TagO [Oceanisphaera sp.]|uniref:type VI secretion system-associated protein TagO n=1 Tax=Oceanisphaera sp. TaxID=1929979 RepID=UPI003C70C049
MKKLILAVIGALTVAAPAMADQVPSSSIEKCVVIERDLARLECYDQIAKAYNLNGPQAVNAQAGSIGKWVIDKKANPIDDSKTVNISLKADSGGSKFSKPIMLAARCDSKKTEMYIDWQTYLGSEAKVTLRIGANDAKTSKWSMPSDKQRSFNDSPISTLKEMLMADKMVAQITPFNQSPYTAVFNTSGLDEAIKPLREACGW